VVFHYVLPGAYIGAAAGWLMAFWRPESPRSRRPIEDYRRAVEAMSEAVEQAKKDSGLLNCRAT
jgi:predicted esterase